MKKYSKAVVTLCLIVAAAITISAQGGARPAGQPAAPQTGPAANVPVPEAKVALVDVGAFYDDKLGIARLSNALLSVDREFTARRSELTLLNQQLQQKTQAYQDQLKAGTTAPQQLAKLQDDIAQMQKDMKRKAEDAQAAYDKRREEVRTPIEKEIGASLQAFAKQRGITLMLDASQLASALLYSLDATDLTRAFIADYNSKNPVIAPTARPD